MWYRRFAARQGSEAHAHSVTASTEMSHLDPRLTARNSPRPIAQRIVLSETPSSDARDATVYAACLSGWFAVVRCGERRRARAASPHSSSPSRSNETSMPAAVGSPSFRIDDGLSCGPLLAGLYDGDAGPQWNSGTSGGSCALAYACIVGTSSLGLGRTPGCSKHRRGRLVVAYIVTLTSGSDGSA